MRAGRLRHRVTIQNKSVVHDSFGEETIIWTTLATVWGQIEAAGGRESVEERQAEAERTVRMTMRYRSDVRPEMRATWSGHTYDIRAVLDAEGRGREMMLICEENA